jgi:hypothetical protein
MNEQEYFFTARPVVTDDDGYLGYLWQGIAYIRRNQYTREFQPIVETNRVFYTPDDAIDCARKICTID